MGMMNKMRENTAVVLWVLVFAFGGIWVLQDSGAFDVVGTGGQANVALVNGEPITYEEYARAVDQYLQQYQAQTGQSASPQLVDLYREQVYNDLVNNKLLEQEMDRLGIKVSDSEVVEMVLGENPDPWVRQTFGDGRGGINREMLQSVIDNPEARQDWIQIEEFLRAKRRQEKLGNLVSATVRVSDQDVVEEYLRRNKQVDAQYVALRYADVPDDQVQVTDSDLRAFYDEHREDFKQERTYTVQYVTLSKIPSAQDSAAIVNDLRGLADDFAAAENDSLFIAQGDADRPYVGSYFNASELEPAVASAVFAEPAPGRVVGPIVAGDQVHLIKIQDVRPAEETVVRASHILVADEATAATVRQRLDAGEDFAALARQFSTDGSAQQGGDLGWFGEGRMVKEFQDAAFAAPVGRVVGPVKTQFGHHLIKVTERASQEVRMADLVRGIRATSGTLGQAQEKAADIQYYAEENGDLQAEAAKENLQVQEVQVQDDMQFIPGLGASRALLSFLQNAKRGAVSDVIELDDQFVVARLAEVTPEGYRPFDQVKPELEPRVLLEKKKEVQVNRLRDAFQKGGFDGLAAAVGAQQQVATGVTFNNTLVPAIGRAPIFTGAVLGMKEGQVSGVVPGETVAFVARVTRVQQPDPAAVSAAEKEQLRAELLNRRRQQVVSQWVQSLRDQADVQDNRRYFQQ